jgi:site-specific DNA-cytosine methylase
MKPIVLSLFDYSGNWARPWLETHRVIISDIRHDSGWTVGADGIERIGCPVDAVLSILKSAGIDRVDVVLAAPPCTHFSRAGAYLWGEKDRDGRTAEHIGMVRSTLAIVDALTPRVWALENPPGRLANKSGTGLMQDELGAPAMQFDPCDYGDAHRKLTYLWGQFLEPTKNRVEPVTYSNGVKSGRNWCARLSSKDERRRSTPLGFSKAFYLANR